ncbi:RnfABCDGE type electron transport complex subunit G [Halorhodospira halochloris]|uniref:RnfABCDGE type electron transport complex subunit G n=1 Tax=Halorhodospira halochloris TaxID=1052 RepID=UPI001EE7A4D5|nr:RnfABCDGE type electron transport complex subunit G [Halorhodospira halochloris]MCG5531341.1 RnfABCDGE type electron transport complex subunit G [Halorhodospira halochloris]
MAWTAALRAGGVLAAFVGVGLALVAGVYELTAERISAAERQVVLDRLEAVLPDEHDNEPDADAYTIPSPIPGGEQARVYPAFSEGEFIAAAVEAQTPEGYAGPISLLIGIDPQGQIIAVRTVYHRETPGLGDAIEASRSDWIETFSGRSLADPPQEDWQLRGDGGEFDGITSATITARAVVDAVRKVLIDFQEQPERYQGDQQ